MDSVARLGGDEFTVILESIRQPQSASIIANKINQVMIPPILIDGREFSVTTSIGIALYPDNGTSLEELIRNADEAMYRVKQQSRNGFQFYSAQLSDKSFERALMEEHLRHALEKDEIKVCYQSLYDMRDGKVIGIEALSRWNSPQLGCIMPELFIPLAEDVGVIQAIDEWVLESACRQMVLWKQQGLDDIRMSVNISSVEFSRINLLEVVSDILEKTHCEASWLELEITESCFIGDQGQATLLLNELKDLGVGLVIDDFGTGYSSLGKLRQLPISKLKIDHSFINNITENDSDAAITRAVIGLAKTLGMTVIAEGVETEQQKQFLLNQDCEQAQGFLFSHPVSAEVMGEKLCLSELN
jgi:predicted signal transduction protein with EAL and GGDEF domain